MDNLSFIIRRIFAALERRRGLMISANGDRTVIEGKWESPLGGDCYTLHDLDGHSLHFCGTPMHIEAIPVTRGENGVLHPVDKEFGFILEALHSIHGLGPLETTIINGRECVLYAVPHST